MSQEVVMGAALVCTFGAGPGTLTVVPKGPPVRVGGQFAGTVLDAIPVANISPFAMCVTPTNPAVAAATTAALGVLTPVPCVPVPTGPWTPGSMTVKINGANALNNTCTCMCAWGGVITVTSPGQLTVNVGP